MPYKNKTFKDAVVLHVRVPYTHLAYIIKGLQAEGLPLEGMTLTSIVRGAIRSAADLARARHGLPALSPDTAEGIVRRHQERTSLTRSVPVRLSALSEALLDQAEDDENRLAPLSEVAERAAQAAQAKIAQAVREAAEIDAEPDSTPSPGSGAARRIPFETLQNMRPACKLLDDAAASSETMRRACEIVLSGLPVERWDDADTRAAVEKMQALLEDMEET